ncbi:hypothetical protein C7S13_0345 [Burkholderia cepacia]|nr:hypothetical protein [Burkholderia cepacia]
MRGGRCASRRRTPRGWLRAVTPFPAVRATMARTCFSPPPACRRRFQHAPDCSPVARRIKR